MGRGHFGYTCSVIVKKGELKGQKVVVKVIPRAKKELITLGLLEWNKSLVTTKIPNYGKKVRKIVNVKTTISDRFLVEELLAEKMIFVVIGFTAAYWKELITLGLLEWNKSRVTTEIPKYGKKVPKIKGELKGQKVVVKVVLIAKKELITLGLLEWNKSLVTTEILKYGKKVPKIVNVNVIPRHIRQEEVFRCHFGYTCSAIVKKGELKGQKVVFKVFPKAKKELFTLGLLEWNKSLVTAKNPKYGKKVPKIVNVKKELITLGLLEWNKSLVTTEILKYGKKVPKIVNVKKGELKGQKVVVKVIPKAKKELIALWLLEWNKSLVTIEIPKYGKKVPKIVNVKISCYRTRFWTDFSLNSFSLKNMISAVAFFTDAYWKGELKGQKVVLKVIPKAKKELIVLWLLEWTNSLVTAEIPKYGKKVLKIVNVKKGELKGQKVVLKVIPKAKKELIALWLLEWNKSLDIAEIPKYGKKVPKIVNVKVIPRNI
ncbi:hypothetical protein H5410_051250 [Solanum commersonii]|uniref:Uncharacterized protein n=1 Tax=Solanum commersonii TaxID=4109 RepID=A0A9J5WZ14_SOLCO|nr:hypothetical protein H5410_051250 [Solanum commersonii]